MTIEESYESIGDDLDWLENLEGVPLKELREISRALGYDVETSEQEFLAMLRSRGLLRDKD